MSNAYRRFQVNHGFFSLLGANMHPCWHPKSTKIQKKRRCQRVPKKHSIFKVMFVRFWCSLGGQLGSKLAPRTAQDGAQERPRAAWDGARDGPETLWKHKAHPRRLGPPKMTPRTLQNESFYWILGSICVDFRRIFEEVLDRFCLHAWPRSD